MLWLKLRLNLSAHQSSALHKHTLLSSGSVQLLCQSHLTIYSTSVTNFTTMTLTERNRLSNEPHLLYFGLGCLGLKPDLWSGLLWIKEARGAAGEKVSVTKAFKSSGLGLVEWAFNGMRQQGRKCIWESVFVSPERATVVSLFAVCFNPTEKHRLPKMFKWGTALIKGALLIYFLLN